MGSQTCSSLLSPLGDRWLHTQSVVERAQEVGKAFDEEHCLLLIAAAYVHDIGYAPSLKVTGFHPLDGAYYLLSHNQNAWRHSLRIIQKHNLRLNYEV